MAYLFNRDTGGGRCVDRAFLDRRVLLAVENGQFGDPEGDGQRTMSDRYEDAQKVDD